MRSGGEKGGIKLREGEESQYTFKTKVGSKEKKGLSRSFLEVQSPPNLAA